jgi:acyl transferase domain-containing protein
LAGGVNLLLSPELTIAFSQSQMMAPDGRCKTFDARANGYVRGEGCGIVVLKRLSDALRDSDTILALIRGSAINQDGLSNGLTAPNGPSQEAVIRQALTNAGVTPAEISYVEVHGTGTSLGDPIEAKALGAVLATGRPPGSY